MFMTMSEKFKAAFIDRDGVINEEKDYVHRIKDFVFLPRAIDGLKLLRDAGYRLIVVTNQAGIARGYYDEASVKILHEHMSASLAAEGVFLDGIYFCPHHPQGRVEAYTIKCGCRKPAPGMLLRAAHELHLDLAESVLIGDKLSDIVAGLKAGVGRTVIVESGHAVDAAAAAEADFLAVDLYAAALALD